MKKTITICVNCPNSLYLWRNDERIVEPALLGSVHVEVAALQAGPAGRNRFSDRRQLSTLLRTLRVQVVNTSRVHAGLQYPVHGPQVGPEVAGPTDHLENAPMLQQRWRAKPKETFENESKMALTNLRSDVAFGDEAPGNTEHGDNPSLLRLTFFIQEAEFFNKDFNNTVAEVATSNQRPNS